MRPVIGNVVPIRQKATIRQPEIFKFNDIQIAGFNQRVILFFELYGYLIYVIFVHGCIQQNECCVSVFAEINYFFEIKNIEQRKIIQFIFAIIVRFYSFPNGFAREFYLGRVSFVMTQERIFDR